jgi:hypothetical protein
MPTLHFGIPRVLTHPLAVHILLVSAKVVSTVMRMKKGYRRMCGHTALGMILAIFFAACMLCCTQRNKRNRQDPTGERASLAWERMDQRRFHCTTNSSHRLALVHPCRQIAVQQQVVLMLIKAMALLGGVQDVPSSRGAGAIRYKYYL